MLVVYTVHNAVLKCMTYENDLVDNSKLRIFPIIHSTKNEKFNSHSFSFKKELKKNVHQYGFNISGVYV